ncbi:MAG: F-type H+-transporting ATPase subunit epsilon [Solirubrobacteraceae bacterium]|nr:F-type H+-transporting ATPase subunit epsilon [Solirubrobacteraceae bacterium]
MAPTTKFPVEVLTPEGEVFNEEVVQISTRTAIGSIGILANHQPMLAMLDPTELRLYSGENDFVTLAQGEGYMQVQRDSRVLILVDEAGKPEDLDASEWEEKRKRAEQEVSDAEEDSHAKHIAERDLRRAEAFLKILKGDSSS